MCNLGHTASKTSDQFQNIYFRNIIYHEVVYCLRYDDDTQLNSDFRLTAER